ncbi:30S ribosomal protein S2 [Candidatus Gottesmanbacteria bacterium]|nr:30S ribosomal protein S2 [Candidatus Gottesmanbacteria bacterium]
MRDVTLKELLEAGCHFGHKVDRWHPKAAEFIYQSRDGLHIIDLAKTREGILKAGEKAFALGKEGKILLFIGTKRQAKGVVAEAARNARAPFMTNRWVGGFFTNWEAVKKNIEKINRMRKERTDGEWQKFPKHEIVKLEKDLRKLEMVYGGVADLLAVPDAVFIVDIKKEIIALTEAQQRHVSILAIVDTNTDPNNVDFPIPANDDAVGSISFIAKFIADCYAEGKLIFEKTEKEAREKTTEKPAEEKALEIKEKKKRKTKNLKN